MARSHFDRVRVEFGDCDPAGIVFFPNYFRWIDAASRQFFSACGVPSWRELEPATGIIGTPLVSVSADFALPASYGDILDVHTTIAEWKNKSFVMEHVVKRGSAIICSAREVRIFAIRHPDDAARIKAVAPPADIRQLCQ
jgi:4-hydroxybenzoyl-CoA thioesterase